ncbi:MAG: pyruvate formate lyase family protein, partial [Victivallales bacterium]|nr:pyruvate formate lyase family protein [Victivallales bacterium]
MDNNLKMKYEKLIAEMRKFYGEDGGHRCADPEISCAYGKMAGAMAEYTHDHPDAGIEELKRKSYAFTVQYFQPKLFFNSPFYFETGINGGWIHLSAADWLFKHRTPLFQGPDADASYFERQRQCYFYCCGPYVDKVHDCPPFSTVLKKGFRAIRQEVCEKLQAEHIDQQERDWLATALTGLDAAHEIQLKYAQEAQSLLEKTSDPTAGRFLKMAAESAARVPWEVPRNFFEGLNSLWFCREIFALLDGMSANSLGAPDAMLIELYRRDLKAGNITEAEAYDLICRFLLAGDCHYDHDSKVVGNIDHEIEISLTLGGCDADGNEIFNELTRLFLRAYAELHLIYPKPHCRFSARSSGEYLRLILRDIHQGNGIYL